MIEVREGRFGKCVFATQRIKKGTVILRGWGERIAQRTQHSFQVDIDTHVVIEGPIQLINHSCEPNVGVYLPLGKQVLEIHALRDLEQGEELFSDYAMFEFEIEHFPGPCLCGSKKYRTDITGYKDLPQQTREAYGPYVAAYLEEMETAGVAAR